MMFLIFVRWKYYRPIDGISILEHRRQELDRSIRHLERYTNEKNIELSWYNNWIWLNLKFDEHQIHTPGNHSRLIILIRASIWDFAIKWRAAVALTSINITTTRNLLKCYTKSEQTTHTQIYFCALRYIFNVFHKSYRTNTHKRTFHAYANKS